jgi:hypothetical protein
LIRSSTDTSFELLKAGFPAVVLPVEQRLHYYHTLDLAHVHGQHQPVIALITEGVNQSFAIYWQALGVQPRPQKYQIVIKLQQICKPL